jgi:hypothetical protein
MHQYRGRFAPSPTGPLHFGSLVVAAGSYLEAKTRGGEWIVRVEDLDPPREQPGAADAILNTLEVCGMGWDGKPIYHSQRRQAYRAALATWKIRVGLSLRVHPAEIADSSWPSRLRAPRAAHTTLRSPTQVSEGLGARAATMARSFTPVPAAMALRQEKRRAPPAFALAKK